MRMLLHVKIPNEKSNEAVRDGSAGEKLNRIPEATKPAAVYFTEFRGPAWPGAFDDIAMEKIQPVVPTQKVEFTELFNRYSLIGGI